MDLRIEAEAELILLMNGHNVGGHDMDHFIAVANHAVEALKYEKLSTRKKIQVELAALLHDADDEKIFPKINPEIKQINEGDQSKYQNARMILNKITNNHIDSEDITDVHDFIDGIIDMIDLVSCSKNGDRDPPEPWMAIPRDCDRLEAIGQIGIDRCLSFTKHKGAPFHLNTTPIVHDEEELWKIATEERFTGYMNGKTSVSMIDHYYDKLLHIGKPKCLKSQNSYILAEADKRNKIMINYVIDYWISVKREL